MTLPELVSKIESSPDDEARNLVRNNCTKDGFSSQFYQEIVFRLGSNPLSAKRLASFWEDLGDGAGKEYDFHRVRALFERTAGKWLRSAEATIAASKAAPDDLQRWQCLIGAIDAFGRAGEVDRAVSLAKRASKQLLLLGDWESVGKVCINASNALLWHDEYAKARKWLVAAKGLLENSANEFAKASVELGLSTCYLFTSTTMQCSETAQTAAQLFDELGQLSYAALARVNEAHCLLRMGRADDARTLLLTIREEPLSDFDRARVEEFLGDAYLRLNLFEEALDAFNTAMKNPAAASLQMNQGNCELGIGEAYASLGQPGLAIAHYKTAKRLYARFGNEIWEGLADLRILQSKPTVEFKRAYLLAEFFSKQRCRLFEVEALLLASRSQSNFAAAALKKAKARIERFGFQHLSWQASYLDAEKSSGERRLNAYRKMCKSILRTREFVSSRSGKVAYYRDKDVAMSEFLDLLLSSGTRSKVDEAIQLISETRSQALLDEAQSLSSGLSKSVQKRIVNLRLAIADAMNDDLPGGNTRRTFVGDSPAISMRRAWIELDLEVTGARSNREPNDANSLVFARGKDSFYAIKDGVATRLPISAEALAKMIRWLRFEMLEPLLDRSAIQNSVETWVLELKSVLWDPFIRGSGIERICPDDCLWHAPWQLFASMDLLESEIPISPWMAPQSNVASKFAKNIGIWYFPNPSLPLIEREAGEFLSRYPNAQVCSTIDEARKCLETGDFDLLHVAGHASLHRTNPMFSALCGEGGKIFAKDIATSKLRAKTVVLSACDTGASSGKSRTEIDGMTRAFLARGAESVIATQWPLQDEAAAIFMNVMYNELGTGSTIEKAIAIARRQTNKEFAHPYYWGAPILYGGFSA